MAKDDDRQTVDPTQPDYIHPSARRNPSTRVRVISAGRYDVSPGGVARVGDVIESTMGQIPEKGGQAGGMGPIANYDKPADEVQESAGGAADAPSPEKLDPKAAIGRTDPASGQRTDPDAPTADEARKQQAREQRAEASGGSRSTKDAKKK